MQALDKIKLPAPTCTFSSFLKTLYNYTPDLKVSFPCWMTAIYNDDLAINPHFIYCQLTDSIYWCMPLDRVQVSFRQFISDIIIK